MKVWNNLAFLQWAAVLSTLVLTVGAILEYRHQLKPLILLIAKWICRKSSPFDRCAFKKLLLLSFGPILVVCGIAGEVVFEGRAFIVEDRQLADRHVTFDQRQKMLAALSIVSARVSVSYIVGAGPDAQEYAAEIGDVFHDAKWIVLPYPWLTSYDVPICGLAVEVREKVASAKRELLEKTVREALMALDNPITVTYGGTDPGPNMNLDMTVFVARKCIDTTTR